MFGMGGDSAKEGETTIDNSAAFADYANAIRARTGTFDPWVNMGNQARDTSMGEYNKLIQNPNFLQDMIASGFNQSPYQNYMQDMATKRMNYNAANTGFMGSGAAQRALQQELTNMTGGFMNDYINRGMSSYGQGLSGLGNMTNLGYKALGDQTSLFEQAAGADLYGQMSKNAYDAAQEANSGSGWGSTIGTIGGGIIGAIYGGPMGASAGAGLGGTLGGMVDGSGQQGGGGQGGGGMGGMGGFGFGGNSGGVGNNGAGATTSKMPQFDMSIFNSGGFSY